MVYTLGAYPELRANLLGESGLWYVLQGLARAACDAGALRPGHMSGPRRSLPSRKVEKAYSPADGPTAVTVVARSSQPSAEQQYACFLR